MDLGGAAEYWAPSLLLQMGRNSHTHVGVCSTLVVGLRLYEYNPPLEAGVPFLMVEDSMPWRWSTPPDCFLALALADLLEY